MYLPDDYGDEFPDDPDPSHFMVDDDDDQFDEGEPTLRMLARALGVDEQDDNYSGGLDGTSRN